MRRSQLPATKQLLAVVAMVAVTAVLVGCGADPHLQRQAAATRATTCQSIVERQEQRAAPSISPTRWLDEVSRPPKLLNETINEREIIDDCLDVEAELDSFDSIRSRYLHFFSRATPTPDDQAGGSTGALLQKLLTGAGAPATATAPASPASGSSRLNAFLQLLLSGSSR